MFRPSSANLQGVHVNYICMKPRLCVNKLSLTVGVVFCDSELKHGHE